MKRPWEDHTCGIENLVQELTTSGRVKMRRVPREQNLADHLTKGKSLREIDDFIRGVGGRMQVSQDNKRIRPPRLQLRTKRDV